MRNCSGAGNWVSKIEFTNLRSELISFNEWCKIKESASDRPVRLRESPHNFGSPGLGGAGFDRFEFDMWMKDVNKFLKGFGVFDAGQDSYSFVDWFKQGLTPKKVATKVATIEHGGRENFLDYLDYKRGELDG